MKAIKVYLEDLVIKNRLRDVDEEKVKVLADSMSKIGLQQPISIWQEPDEHNLGAIHLVAGLHRVRAAESLGWEDIDAIEVNLNEIDRRRWEIAENLHRSELTALERSEHVAEWIRLTEESDKVRQVDAVSTQVVAKIPEHRKRGRPEGGVKAAAREIGVNREDARRAVKVASLSDEAKEVAREVGLDDNRSALLEAARAPKEKQAEVLRDIAEKKKEKPEPVSVQWTAEDERSYGVLLDAWERATDAARNQFLRECTRKVA